LILAIFSPPAAAVRGFEDTGQKSNLARLIINARLGMTDMPDGQILSWRCEWKA
jgi:hypothetical protein